MSFSSGLRDQINRNGLPLGKLHCEGHYMGNLMSKLEVLFGASSSYTAPGTPAVGTILCGQSNGTYLSKAMSGDVTVGATGTMAIGADKVLPAMVDDDADFIMASLSFATAASSYLKMIERSGDPTNVANYGQLYVKDVTAVSELFYIDDAGNVTQLTSGGYVNAGEVPLVHNYIFVGNGSGVATGVAQSGDISVSDAGAFAISSGVIINDDVKSDAAIAYSKLNLATSILNADINASAAIAYSKLASLAQGSVLSGQTAGGVCTALVAKSDGYILIGDGTDINSVAVSGDISLSNAGATAIGSGKVKKAMLDSGVQPVYMCMSAVAEDTMSREENVDGLSSALALDASLFTIMNAHAADGAEHYHGGSATPDSVNFPLVEPSSDIASLIVAVTEKITAYVLHDTDAKQATPTYHNAQYGGSDLASATPPTNLQECITILNDIKAKYNIHDADSTAHTTGSTHQEATSDADYGVVNLVSVSGLLSGDVVCWNILDSGTGTVTGVSAVAGTGSITFTFDADPQNDAILSYSVFRATS